MLESRLTRLGNRLYSQARLLVCSPAFSSKPASKVLPSTSDSKTGSTSGREQQLSESKQIRRYPPEAQSNPRWTTPPPPSKEEIEQFQQKDTAFVNRLLGINNLIHSEVPSQSQPKSQRSRPQKSTQAQSQGSENRGWSSVLSSVPRSVVERGKLSCTEIVMLLSLASKQNNEWPVSRLAPLYHLDPSLISTLLKYYAAPWVYQQNNESFATLHKPLHKDSLILADYFQLTQEHATNKLNPNSTPNGK